MVQSLTATYDGHALLPDRALDIRPNRRYIITIREYPILPENDKSAWDVLDQLAGSLNAPEDWAAEHNHYLYGTPKKNNQE